MQIYNLISKQSGRPVANQFAIICKDGTRYFRSYKSNICKIEPNGAIYIANDAWLSRTTMKYLNQFLEMKTKQIKDNISKGNIKLIEMNNL